MDTELRKAIDELLEIKKRTTEKEENPQMPEILSFIETEIQKQKEIVDSLEDDHNKDWNGISPKLQLHIISKVTGFPDQTC